MLARLRRPAGLVEQTRWLFCISSLLALLLTAPAALRAPGVNARLLGFGCAGVLAASWSYRYLSGRYRVTLGVVEVAAVFGFALATPGPVATFGFVISASWFRAAYGRRPWQAVLHGGASGLAIVASVVLWRLAPWQSVAPDIGPVLGTLPILFLTMWMSLHLIRVMYERDQAQRRDAALAVLGQSLLGQTGRDEIRGQAWEAILAICEATPGLHALTLVGEAGDLAVRRCTSGLDPARDRVPHAAVEDRRGGTGEPANEPRPPRDSSLLPTADGRPLTWLCLPLPEQRDNWLLLAAHGTVPAEAVSAAQSVVNHVALALRNSDVHSDLTTAALTDGLTGLANRAAFAAALEEGLRAPHGLAVLFLDLDDFKPINDGLGHAAGDELLRHVAARLTRTVRSGDVCARLGGDEFAVLLNTGDEAAARRVAGRLVELVAQPVALGDRQAHVGASVGLALATAGMTGQELVQQADIAMYAAKAQGKNQVQVFGPHLLEPDPAALFAAELAAAADAGQLVVYYQPILSLEDGSCTAVEALVRWQHPVRGLLAPDEFIPVAERTGAIAGIGAYVLIQAGRDIAGRTGRDGPLAVHVNVSASQLDDPDFLQTVRTCLTGNQLAPRQLVLELTESVPLDSPAVRRTLAALAELDVALALDDFGTGYSCLTALRQLPLDIIKIDQSFVSDSPTSAPSQAVVESIVQLARRLGMQTVAEGVERLDQQRYLQSIGVDAAQGFMNLHPVPLAELETWLAAEHSHQQPDSRASITRLAPRRPA